MSVNKCRVIIRRVIKCHQTDSNIFKVEDHRKPKINHLTLMFDLENLGQIFFCMTFHISGCKHDTKSILVSILTFSRSKISKIIKTNTWPYRLTLKLKVIHFSHMTLLISGCMPAIYSILVSNLTYSRSRISENLFPVTWPWCQHSWLWSHMLHCTIYIAEIMLKCTKIVSVPALHPRPR